MKKPFSDPIAIKGQNPKDKPIDGKNSPWDFTCPQYDQRSSDYVKAGTYYGVGHNQPIGHAGNAKPTAETLPQKSKMVKLYEGH